MLDLNRIPKPVKNPKNCGLRMLANDGSVPTLNLFKNKRCRGWWPMFAKDSDQLELVVSMSTNQHQQNVCMCLVFCDSSAHPLIVCIKNTVIRCMIPG